MQLLIQVIWNKSRVLDFGCDKGLMLKFICDSFPQVDCVGIDINSKAIESARELLPKQEFRSFDGMNIPYPDKHFDLVFVCAVIKHVRYEDREHVYSEIRRVADKVFFIEIDAKQKESVKHESWTFYYSNFEQEFSQHFNPVKVIHEAGDILGLYDCNAELPR